MTAAPLSPQQADEFHRRGWTTVRGLLEPAAAEQLAATCMRFLRRELAVPGKDYCDMTGSYHKPIEDYDILNVMLPGRYFPDAVGDAYERSARRIAEQLLGPDIGLDYDQLVCKPPHKQQAVFHWHQDLAYWPATADTRTATFWLALDVCDATNGGVHFVPGSHLEPRLRPHRPLLADRGDNHSLLAQLQHGDAPHCERLMPGDCTVHHERTLHGSPGNGTSRWRRGWVLAFRSEAAIAQERAMGFTHSHNDDPALLRRIAERTRRTGDEP